MGILDLLFPVSCLECKKSGRYFCDNCLSKVPVLNQFDPYNETFSVFKYEGVIRKGIIKIKYNFAYDIAKELGDYIAKNINLKLNNIILIPIPLHKSRENWRGFNQSEIIGKLVAEKLNWSFDKNILIRTFQGKTQVGLHKSERVRNMRGKFAVNPEAKIDQSTTYIIFDDVATTGSTIKEGIKVLKDGGANKVFGLTIAR